jgi:hypothetical protein
MGEFTTLLESSSLEDDVCEGEPIILLPDIGHIFMQIIGAFLGIYPFFAKHHFVPLGDYYIAGGEAPED